MKKLPLAIAILAMSASSAFSADLAARPYTKAPPMIAAMYDWSGFYIGINGGGGSAHTCWDLVFPGGSIPQGCHNSTGGTAGGQVGFRWQSANWVFGLEGQGNWADFSGRNITPVGGNPFGGGSIRTRIDAFGLITGQVGYAWNNVLAYVKGGAAVVSDKYDVFFAGAVADTGKETRWGGTVGAGLEFGFAPNWSVGVEYDHVFLDSKDTTLAAVPAGAASTIHVRQDVDMGLVRLNYRFGGPLIAKY
ncbi:outer membrane protein [Bradyrhizobium sp. AZCC 2230]|uniref:outer membrane protein n=1 Tax=Bradyrhizobium sp. AZCC 2230 TaxID=3117021 RepID=UPI002FEFACA2